MTVFLDGNRIQKISYSIETSRRTIDRDYYFHDEQPVLVVETSHYLLDDQANHLAVPRFEYRRSYRLDKPGEVPADKESAYENHVTNLLRYFARHRKEFNPVSSLK